MPPSASKKRKNDDGSINLEGYSPVALRIHMNSIYQHFPPVHPDGFIQNVPGKAKIRCIYTPTLGQCVLKEFFIPKPLSEFSAEEIQQGETLKKYREREIQYTSAIDNHPNILRFYGYAVDDTQVRGLISEYMPLGSLANVLLNYFSLCTSERITNWAVQLARALAYCHEANIVHRDVKLDNVLLSADGETIKLCDFEFARQISHDMTSQVGTAAYIAPEVIGRSNYNFKADVWSYGMCLYGMTHRRLPFSLDKKTSLYEFKNMLEEGLKPEVIPNDAYNPLLYTLMAVCWELNPEYRPSMLTIVKILDPESGQYQQPLG